MKDKKFITLGAILVALVAIIGISAASFAYEGAQGQKHPAPWQNSPEWDEDMIAEKKAWFEEKKAEKQVKMEAVKVALESGDYQTWLDAVGSDSKIAQEVTADELPRLIEAHGLAQEGKALFEQSRAIRDEIGLKPSNNGNKRFNKGFGQRMMNHGGMGVHHLED